MSFLSDIHATIYDLLVTKIEEEVDNLIIRSGGNLKDLTVIDCGCGTEDLAHRLSEKGALVRAIDFSDGMLRLAKRKYGNNNIEWIKAEFTNYILQQPHNSVDFVISKKSLYDGRTDVFCEAVHKALTVNGRITILLPNEQSLSYIFLKNRISLKHFFRYATGKIGDMLCLRNYNLSTREEIMDNLSTYFKNIRCDLVGNGAYPFSTGIKR